MKTVEQRLLFAVALCANELTKPLGQEMPDETRSEITQAVAKFFATAGVVIAECLAADCKDLPDGDLSCWLAIQVTDKTRMIDALLEMEGGPA